MSDSVRVFVAYARDDQRHLEAFRTYVADLERDGVEFFDDRDIDPGDPWEQVLLDRLDTADIVVLLLTANFVASDFCMQEEVPRAMRRVEAGRCLVVPLNVAPFHLRPGSPLREGQWTPSGKPIAKRGSATAQAWVDAAWALRKQVDRWRDSNKDTRPQNDNDTDSSQSPGGQQPEHSRQTTQDEHLAGDAFVRERSSTTQLEPTAVPGQEVSRDDAPGRGSGVEDAGRRSGLFALALVAIVAIAVVGVTVALNIHRPPANQAPSTLEPLPTQQDSEGGVPTTLDQTTVEPQIVAVPGAGQPGTKFQVRGTGYPANYMIRISMWRPDVAPTGPIFMARNDVKVDGEGKFVATIQAPSARSNEDDYMIEVRATTMDGGVESNTSFLVHG